MKETIAFLKENWIIIVIIFVVSIFGNYMLQKYFVFNGDPHEEWVNYIQPNLRILSDTKTGNIYIKWKDVYVGSGSIEEPEKDNMSISWRFQYRYRNLSYKQGIVGSIPTASTR